MKLHFEPDLDYQLHQSADRNPKVITAGCDCVEADAVIAAAGRNVPEFIWRRDRGRANCPGTFGLNERLMRGDVVMARCILVTPRRARVVAAAGFSIDSPARWI